MGLFRTSAFTSLFSPVLRCWFRVLLHMLQELHVDVKCFHVSLADIHVAQLWAAFGSPSRCQLSIENVFLDAAILHAVGMPQPTQPALSEQGEHTWKVGSGQGLGVGQCLAKICQGYGGCFSGGRNFLFSCLAYVVHISLPYMC